MFIFDIARPGGHEGKEEYEMYGIEIIGRGKHTCYCIQRITRNGTTPVNYARYKTEAAAMHAAQQLNITISAVGDFYSLMAAFDRGDIR